MARGWPFVPVGLLVLALALFALSDRLEGATLLTLGPGHALSVLDGAALSLLLVGCFWLYWGL